MPVVSANAPAAAAAAAEGLAPGSSGTV